MAYIYNLNDRNIIAGINSTNNGLVPIQINNGALKVETPNYTINNITSDDISTYKITYVTLQDTIDFPTSYVTSSDGQIKSIKAYKTGSNSSEQALLVNYLYEDANNPEQYTTITESLTTVGGV